MISLNLKKPTLIYGDFNARIDIPNGDKAADLIEVLSGFGLKLVTNNSEKTYLCHNGGSIIDLVFASAMSCSVALDRTSNMSTLRKHLPVKISAQTVNKVVVEPAAEVVKFVRKVRLDDLDEVRIHGVRPP